MIRQAILLVGGRGTRLWPLTDRVPKGLVTVAGVPFLDLQLELLRRVGVTDVILAVGTSHIDAWKTYTERDHDGIQVSLTVEQEPLDTAGALVASVDRLDDRFLVLNGDVVIETSLGKFLDLAAGADAALALSEVEDPSAYGVVVTDAEGLVTAFVEKPAPGTAPTNTVSAGIYVMERSVFEGREPGRLSFERVVFPELAAQQRLSAYVVAGSWLDIGTPQLLIDTHRHVLRGNSALIPSDDHGSAWAWVSPTAKVDGSATVERSVVLDGASVGAGTIIRDSVIGPEVMVGSDCSITDYVMVGDGATIGPSVELSAGARVAPDAIIGAESIRFTPPQ